MANKRALVTGSSGFIASHLVKRLKSEGYWVRGVDIKEPEFEKSYADEFLLLDLRDPNQAEKALGWRSAGMIDDVYQLGADMGGIGYITQHLADITRNNVLINVNTLNAAVKAKVKRYLYTSSACVYNQNKQLDANAVPLKEEDAWPALPEDGYGLEKLFTEKLCEYYHKDYGLDVRVVRFHNCYGEKGSWKGGKEKSPAALCRKVATAIRDKQHFIEIWGDGKATRSYLYIEDCTEGIRRIMESRYTQPLNLGTDELVSIDELANKIQIIAGKGLWHKYDLSAPTGVRGRNSDNTKLREVLNWEPRITLDEGLVPTYEWIAAQVNKEK